jgi:hypothetical protein
VVRFTVSATQRKAPNKTLCAHVEGTLVCHSTDVMACRNSERAARIYNIKSSEPILALYDAC